MYIQSKLLGQYNIGDKLYCIRKYYSIMNNIYYYEGFEYYVVNVQNFVTIGLRAGSKKYISGSAMLLSDDVSKFFLTEKEVRKKKLERLNYV